MRQLIGITTAPLALEYNPQRAELSIRQTKPLMEIETVKPELNVKYGESKLNIDYSQVNESLGIYKPLAMARKVKSEGRQHMIDLIGTFASDGSMCRDPEALGNALPQIAQRYAVLQPVELVEEFIPEKPSISWQIGNTSVTFSPHQLNMTPRFKTTADIDATRGEVNISVKKWHDVKIAYDGTVDDVTPIGRETRRKLGVV